MVTLKASQHNSGFPGRYRGGRLLSSASSHLLPYSPWLSIYFLPDGEKQVNWDILRWPESSVKHMTLKWSLNFSSPVPDCAWPHPAILQTLNCWPCSDQGRPSTGHHYYKGWGVVGGFPQAWIPCPVERKIMSLLTYVNNGLLLGQGQ